MRKILVSQTLDQIKVAVLDNSKLTNFFIDSSSLQSSIRGNIYKAKKNLTAKGIEASFVEIDDGKSASVNLFKIDVTGFRETRIITPSDGSDPAWSPLLPN